MMVIIVSSRCVVEMSDGITDATRTDQIILDTWREREINSFLSNLSTTVLITELVKRGILSKSLHCQHGEQKTYCLKGLFTENENP
jgi:hypothetical protein